jgi:hypothetical protein
MTLVSHLRNDNNRLREALVAAQHECEALVLAQQQKENEDREAASPGIDFGHLLELVRDFGADGLGGSEVIDTGADGWAEVQVFNMESPRGEEPQEEEATLLRDELEESRQEIARLRAELAARDSQ